MYFTVQLVAVGMYLCLPLYVPLHVSLLLGTRCTVPWSEVGRVYRRAAVTLNGEMEDDGDEGDDGEISMEDGEFVAGLHASIQAGRGVAEMRQERDDRRATCDVRRAT